MGIERHDVVPGKRADFPEKVPHIQAIVRIQVPALVAVVAFAQLAATDFVTAVLVAKVEAVG